MIEVSERKHDIIKIEPVFGDINGTYSTIMAKINEL
jgi:hypothetical protein